MASFKLNAAADEDEDVTFSTAEVVANVSNGVGSTTSASIDAPLLGSASTDSNKAGTTSSSSAIDRFRESAGDKKKCPNCAKTVFKVEELLALGCIWHKDCFTCGGPAPSVGEPEHLGCGRVLTIDAHDQHAGLPYCKACFQRNFMLGGARGAVLNIPERQTSFSSPHPPLETSGSFSHLGGGGAKCGKCNKTVYKMEEVSCIGSIWHKGCFTCGGATELGCNRTLLVPDYEQHAGTPFCKACFMKNFMKGGARGVALEGEFQTMGLSDNHNNSGLSPTAGGGSSSTHVPYRSATTSSSSSATGGGAAASSSSGAKPAGGKFAFLGGGAKCPACTKTVYKMEEVVASGCSWHKECFSCGKLPGGTGGKSEDGCGMNMANRPFEEVKGVPYCVPCWRKVLD